MLRFVVMFCVLRFVCVAFVFCVFTCRGSCFAACAFRCVCFALCAAVVDVSCFGFCDLCVSCVVYFALCVFVLCALSFIVIHRSSWGPSVVCKQGNQNFSFFVFFGLSILIHFLILVVINNIGLTFSFVSILSFFISIFLSFIQFYIKFMFLICYLFFSSHK